MGALPGSESLLTTIVLLLALAAVALVFAFVPRWRRNLSWGRGADAHPVSRLGCLLACSAFLVMAAGPTAVRLGVLRPPVGLLVALLGFLLFVAAGQLDRPRG